MKPESIKYKSIDECKIGDRVIFLINKSYKKLFEQIAIITRIVDDEFIDVKWDTLTNATEQRWFYWRFEKILTDSNLIYKKK